mgnify:CR=1 FL=1
MSQSLPARAYTPSEWLHWCLDAQQVNLVDRRLGKPYTLRGLPAAVWGWFSLGYDRLRVVELVAVAQAQTQTDTQQVVRALVEQWVADGLLVEK